MLLRPIVNKIRCKYCIDILESKSVHDFRQCSCGACFTDGGHKYIRRGYLGEKPEDCYEDLSTYEVVSTGEIIKLGKD